MLIPIHSGKEFLTDGLKPVSVRNVSLRDSTGIIQIYIVNNVHIHLYKDNNE